MEKTVLIAGKNIPEGSDFIEGFTNSGRKVAVSAHADYFDETKKLSVAERKANQIAYEEEKLAEVKSGLCTIEWLRSSPLSARSFVLQAASFFGKLDEAVLYFDEEWYASKADKMDSEEISKGTDEMILGYQYLALEIFSHFQKRNSAENPGTLVFLIKQTPDRIDVINTPVLKNGIRVISSPLVAASSSAFMSFAENLAAVFRDSEFMNVVLIKGNASDTGFRRDDETGKWVASYLDNIAKKNEGYSSHEVKWISPSGDQNEKMKEHAKQKTGLFNLWKK